MFLRRIFEAIFITDNSPKPVVTNNQKKSSGRKRDAIPPEIRDAVWMKYHGTSFHGNCYTCGTPIEKYHAQWHCSHVIADSKGGKEIVENLRTCCRHCNLSMGNQNLYVYIQQKGLNGPGSRNVKSYLSRHPSQKFDKRTNNWGKSKK